jgi:hypothetical protein
MKVDPDNRLVADALEAEWNEKLRVHTDVVDDYGQRGLEEAAALDGKVRRQIRELAEQFPKIWGDPRVDVRERKRIVRLLITDVTLIKADSITAHVRLSGGATRTLILDRPQPIAQIRKFKPDLVAEVDLLLNKHCDREISDIFNKKGLLTWEGKPLDLKKITHIRNAYKLPSRRQRLRDRGMLTTEEVAERFEIATTTVHQWGRQGLIKKCYSDNYNRGLWEIPSDCTILKGQPGRHPRPASLAPITAPFAEQGAI